MSELKHWLDEGSEADEFERSILRAGLDADPPEAKRDQIWSGLVSTLAIAPLTAATVSMQAGSAQAAATGASKAAAVWLAVGKGFLVGLAIYGASVGVSEVANRLGPAPARALPAPPARTPARALSSGSQPLASASTAPLTTAGEDAPAAPRAAQRGDTSVSSSARASANPAATLPSIANFEEPEQPSSARVSQLDAEARALRHARAELRAGQLTDAFATLEASRRQFSAPELYQEREALMIELLSRSGQVSAAEQRARAFLSRFPDSPHAQQVRRFGGT